LFSNKFPKFSFIQKKEDKNIFYKSFSERIKFISWPIRYASIASCSIWYSRFLFFFLFLFSSNS